MELVSRGAFSARRPTLASLNAAWDRIGLPAWFVTIDLVYTIFRPETFGIDARHYQRAADAWLSGGNPWAVTEYGLPFAAGPHTLLFYAPTAAVPLEMSVAFWMTAGLAASIWLLRKLGLPLWWLAFPPLAHGIWNGNPHTIVVALLVAGGPLPAALSVGLKLYAAVPLLVGWRDRWRALAFAAVALAVTLPLLPIHLYLMSGSTGVHLATAWNGSAWHLPILVPPTLLALWILRRRGAEWLAVPAVWPGTQLYYNSIALPALTRRPLLAAALAVPIPLAASIGVLVLAVSHVWQSRETALGRLPQGSPSLGRNTNQMGKPRHK